MGSTLLLTVRIGNSLARYFDSGLLMSPAFTGSKKVLCVDRQP